MSYLVVGLGSMGKRRVRNLMALGIRDIVGVDTRSDRRAEAQEKYGIETFGDLQVAFDGSHVAGTVVSTSPENHVAVATAAVAREIPAFIEASVVDVPGLKALDALARKSRVVVAPSCTMRYFEGPKLIKSCLAARTIGDPLVISYHTGQYLADWHPWERVEDYYVSKRETGGCREIVPFELTWLAEIFGTAEAMACSKARVNLVQLEIDDVYQCLVRFGGSVMAAITVDVLSRPVATRELRLIGTEGILVMSADLNAVRYRGISGDDWSTLYLDKGSVESGYINPEEPYIAEMRDFVTAAAQNDPRLFPNSLTNDIQILETLGKLEELSEERR